MSAELSTSIYHTSEIRRHVGLTSTALAAIENAFTWLATGRAQMPPVMHLEVEDGRGDVDVKSAYVVGEDRFAIKIASGFFGNASLGLPTGSGLMVVLSAKTGLCDAVLLDNGYLTDLRTALAGAVAAKHLAPSQLDTVGIVGTGVQARFQIEALTLVREFSRLLVFGRDPARRAIYRDEMSARLGSAVDVLVVDSLEELMRESGCVVTTTPSREPLLRAEWLHPGLHITAMGSDLPGKQELEADILRRADLVACDAQSQASVLGELQHLDAAAAVPSVELGSITSGAHAGRTDDQAVTVCDLTGVGVQDTAIAIYALERLGRAPIG